MLRRDPHISQQASHGSTGVWQSKASLASHAFISVSFIILYVILCSTLVLSLISCSSSTLQMPVMWGACIAPSITIKFLIAVICYIASAVCFIDRRCSTQLSEGLVWSIRFDMLSTTAKKTPFLSWICVSVECSVWRESPQICFAPFEALIARDSRWSVSLHLYLRTEHFQSKLHSISWKFRILNLL